MGNRPVKSSNRKLNKTTKKTHGFCCFNSSHSLSSLGNDGNYYPTFDRLSKNKHQPTTVHPSDKNHELTSKKRIYYCQSIEDLQKSLHGTASIDQWIDSLPILGTPSLYHLKTKPIECQLINHENEQLERILTRKSNREVSSLTKKFHLNFYLKDYLYRTKNSQIKQTFKNHFLSSKIIYPCNGTSQVLVDDLNLISISPPESILPDILTNANSSYKIHEQIRSKCYFIPLTNCKIEPDDDEYKQNSIQLDRTHVVITLDNTKTTTQTNKTSSEFDSSFIFTSNDSFQTGFIRIDPEKMSREFSSFIHYCSEENLSCLSSDLIQQWFNTLILVNQTCAIVKRFLLGDGSHITCLLKEQMNNSSNQDNAFSNQNNLIFASLRLPPCAQLTDSLSTHYPDGKSDQIVDAFSPVFLSDNQQTSSNAIHIDYEQYSFGLLLRRWPKPLIDHYYTHPKRHTQRQWPSKYYMDILVQKSLLLIPNEHTHQWEVNFDLIEENLFELMDESTLYFYILCQQLFSPTSATRTLIKHCFLNYCEKYGLPFSKNQNNILDLLTSFLKDLSEQINRRFLPNYFNHQINLLKSTENYHPWFEYITRCINDRIYLISSSASNTSNRSIIFEFIFHFIDQLYRTFHLKRSDFHLNDQSLLDLHKQVCETLSNDTNNNQQILFQKIVNELLNNQPMIDGIQRNLTYEFETNAELVHTCLNQIRKAQTSLIFHYTWTIYIQYLHTYYNVLWNVERRFW